MILISLVAFALSVLVNVCSVGHGERVKCHCDSNGKASV